MAGTDELSDLLCRLRAGEPGAADEMARVVRPVLVRMARSRVRDASLVDDVAQESLVEVLATFEALRHPEAMQIWLRLIVRKHADRAVRGLRPTVPLDSTLSPAECSDGPELLVERRGDVDTIRRALAVVRDADALLLRLRYLGEWTDAELAELVDATPGTVRKRLHDARRRLRSAVVSPPLQSHPLQPEVFNMSDVTEFLGRVIPADEVPNFDPADRAPSGQRLGTGLKVLDAVLPVELGGTVDLLGPAGLGQLVLVAEIAAQSGGTVVAAGDGFGDLIADDDLRPTAVVVTGPPSDAATAADRLAGEMARAGHTVLLVVDRPTWAAGPPRAGLVGDGPGSVTAFRFAPHPRDSEPVPGLDDAGTTLVYATEPFVEGHHPAVDVLSSRSRLVESAGLDPVTVGTARAARETLRRAAEVRAFLGQPLLVGTPYTGVAGEHVPAREATEQLAALVR